MDGVETINGLDEDEIYAFQIKYNVRQLGDDIKVFSVRDAYVWPSDEPPDERVATFPSFGRHANNTFEYVICDWTFDHPDSPTVDEGATWAMLIEDAFGRWQTALDDFITVRPKPGGNCPIGPTNPADQMYPSEMQTFLMIDDDQNNVRMFDSSGDKRVFAFPELKADVFKVCVTSAPACVTSFRDYSGLDDEEIARLRGEIDRNIQRYLDDELSYIAMVAELFLAIQGYLWFSGSGEFGDPIRGVDVSFRQSAFQPPPNFSPVMPSSNARSTEIVRFNTCLESGTPDTDDSDPREPFYPYALAVHEAGHALGLSGFNRNLVFKQGYAFAHPTIPESVLNYDRESEGRPHWVPSTYLEPDCSPHPFDVMAIYALYQSQ